MSFRFVQIIWAVLVVVAASVYVLTNYSQLERYEALNIVAVTDNTDSAEPVYAQFVVTQEVALSEEIQAVALEVPIYSQLELVPVEVSLLQDGEVVAATEHITMVHGNEVVRMEFSTPIALHGELEVRLAVPDVSARTPERAIYVFVQKADEHYPDGNYRVAANEKVGDIALKLLAERTRWERVLGEWRVEPLVGVQAVGKRLLVVLLLTTIPRVVHISWLALRQKVVRDRGAHPGSFRD